MVKVNKHKRFSRLGIVLISQIEVKNLWPHYFTPLSVPVSKLVSGYEFWPKRPSFSTYRKSYIFFPSHQFMKSYPNTTEEGPILRPS